LQRPRRDHTLRNVDLPDLQRGRLRGARPPGFDLLMPVFSLPFELMSCIGRSGS
jgi:hypothetical protein